MRLSGGNLEYPEDRWSVSRDGGYDVTGEWEPGYSYTCTKYVLPHHWFALRWPIGGYPTLQERWFDLERNVLSPHLHSPKKLRSMRQVLRWADEHMALALRLRSMRFHVAEAMQPENADHLYELVGRVLIPRGSLFGMIQRSSTQLYGLQSVVGETEGRWPSGTYFVISPCGKVRQIALTGSGVCVSFLKAEDNLFPVLERLHRWGRYGLPEFAGIPYQLGQEVVCCPPWNSDALTARGLFGRVVGVPLAEDEGNLFYKLDTLEATITHRWLCTPEEWAAEALAT